MKTIKSHILIATIIISLLSCVFHKKETEKTRTKSDNSTQPALSGKQLNDKLEYFFKQSQPDSFKQIFAHWNQTIMPDSDDFINQNDTIQTVFSVFKVLYKPLDLLKLGEWEWGNKLNSNSQYVVVQNSISYAIQSSDNPDHFDWEKSEKRLIENFKPPIDLDPSRVLYLTGAYEEAINKFLGEKSTELGDNGIMNPSQAAGESEERYKALRPFIPVLHGHWGGYWHLETHPFVDIIVFNKTLTKAKAEFRVGYQGGAAELTKTGNGWTITESKATWIE